MVNQVALEKFEALKTATLELSATCSRPSAGEAEIRKGMAELGCALHEMEQLWEHIDPSRRTAYEQQAESTQLMALKHVRNVNPMIKTLEEAIGTRIPYQEKIVTRSKGKLLAPSRLDIIASALSNSRREEETTQGDDTHEGQSTEQGNAGNHESQTVAEVSNANVNTNNLTNSHGSVVNNDNERAGPSGMNGVEKERKNREKDRERSRKDRRARRSRDSSSSSSTSVSSSRDRSGRKKKRKPRQISSSSQESRSPPRDRRGHEKKRVQTKAAVQ